MTEVKELVATMNARFKEEKCPFCQKKPVGHETGSNPDKKKPKKIVSKPSSLKCDPVSGGGVGKHTTAQHHLICAIQCFAKVRRLAAMATIIGYDINAPRNGLGLPTVKNQYDAKVTDKRTGKRKRTKMNYGKLQDDEKRVIANRVMRLTKAQWHVGDHDTELQLPDDYDTEEGGEDSEYMHFFSYDGAVIERLYKIALAWIKFDVCKEEDDKRDDLKAELDKLSDDIKAKLKQFKARNPWGSLPYFVSDRAYRYALDRRR
jgi:hypothetical protein